MKSENKRKNRGALEWMLWWVLMTGWHWGVQGDLALKGIHSTPHPASREMRYRRPADPSLGALVRMFVVNEGKQRVDLHPSQGFLFRGRTGQALVDSGEWTWFDTPSLHAEDAYSLPPGGLVVLEWNGARSDWGPNTQVALDATLLSGEKIHIGDPALTPSPVSFRAITFLGHGEDPRPHEMALHLQNDSDQTYTLSGLRLWTPSENASSHIFEPTLRVGLDPLSSTDRILAPGQIWSQKLEMGSLELGYAIVEAQFSSQGEDEVDSIMAKIRVRREMFDISGGWVSSELDGKSTLTYEPFLQTLRGMHLNTAHIGEIRGYTDHPELYARYPLKRFHKLEDTQRYGAWDKLKEVHAVEFLGEPQYGGGRPVPPMEVHRALLPYRNSRLATTVTHSEERIWRFYAGLSDFPHYDAYRVVAPAADSWSAYDRWEGERIRWGAPLETIGTMTRSLRDLYRPVSIGYWSQGAHNDWSSRRRPRSSPTPDELRMQAWQAMANRITSLYWFNLSLESLLAFPDLMKPIAEVNRMALILSPWMLEGVDSYHRRVSEVDQPQWDFNAIQTHDTLLLFVINLAYTVDPVHQVFQFTDRRETFVFPHLGATKPDWQMWRLTREGMEKCQPQWQEKTIRWEDQVRVEGVYVLSADPKLASILQDRRNALESVEQAMGFDLQEPDAAYQHLSRWLKTRVP